MKIVQGQAFKRPYIVQKGLISYKDYLTASDALSTETKISRIKFFLKRVDNSIINRNLRFSL